MKAFTPALTNHGEQWSSPSNCMAHGSHSFGNCCVMPKSKPRSSGLAGGRIPSHTAYYLNTQCQRYSKAPRQRTVMVCFTVGQALAIRLCSLSSSHPIKQKKNPYKCDTWVCLLHLKVSLVTSEFKLSCTRSQLIQPNGKACSIGFRPAAPLPLHFLMK